MKKTIFDLSYSEIKEVEKELKTSAYGKTLFFVANSIVLLVLVIFVLLFAFSLMDNTELFTDTFMYFLFLAFFFQVLLKWKWMQLVKTYYEEKNNK